MSHLFYYLRGALGQRSLVKEHEEVLSRLLSGDYQSGNLEKLKGHDVYSFRLNKPGRLLFTVVTIDGEKRLLVLDYLPTHDYDKSKFLKSQVLKHYLEKVVLNGSDVDNQLDFLSLAPEVGRQLLPLVTQETLNDSPDGIAVDYFQSKVIQLRDEQVGALSLPLPSAIRGGAGSGKTAVALSIISSSFDSDINQDEPEQQRILYVAQSSHLVKAVRSAWEKLPQALDTRHQVLFKTYDDLIKERPGGAGATLVGEAEFNDWYKDFCANERQSSKAKKRAYEAPVPASDVYQECRLCSGYTQEEYAQLGQKQSLISKDKRVWIYGLYTRYKEYLHNKNFIDSAFYKLVAPAVPHVVDPTFNISVEQEQEAYDLVLVDEGQDLSLGQLLDLSNLAKERQFVVCMDDNQRLNDELSMFSRGCELLRIPNGHRVTLHGSHRCPPQIMSVARQVLKFRELLAQGIIEKNYGVEENKEDTTSKMGGVYVVDEQKLKALSWLEKAAKGVDFAVITSEEHVEEAKKQFKTPLIFTPKQIKGLEYRVVMAWRLYSPDIFEDMSRRMRNLGPTAKQPMHQAKNGLGDSSFNPHLHAVYTSYTRATEMLIISEPLSRGTKLLLDKILPFTEKDLPSGDVVQATRASNDEWLLEVKKQIDSGNDDLAREIYVAQQLGTREQFDALINTRRLPQISVRIEPEDDEKSIPLAQQVKEVARFDTPTNSRRSAQGSLRRALEDEDNKVAPTFAQRAKGDAPFSEHKNRAFLGSREKLSPSQAAKIPLPEVPVVVRSREQKGAQSLCTDFTGQKLKLLLTLPIYNIEQVFLSEVFDANERSTLLHFILKNQKRSDLFFQLIANDLDVLMRMPFQRLVGECSQHEEVQKLLGFLNLIQLKFCAIARSSAVEKNSPEIFNLLSNYMKPGNINANTWGATPAMVAAVSDDIQGLSVLLIMGANLNTPDKEKGYMPAHFAAANGHVDVLKELDEFGVDLNTLDKIGRSPAHIAAEKGHVDVLKALKGMLVDLNTADEDGFTPAHIAAGNGHVAVLRALRELGVNLDRSNKDGVTPAHFAAENGDVAILSVLGESGVNLLDAPNHGGATPTFIAVLNGHLEALRFLIKSGCSPNTSFKILASRLKDCVLNKAADVQGRVNAHIEKQKQLTAMGADQDLISISIADIAFIMGHQDCLILIKEAIVESQGHRVSRPSFFASPEVEDVCDEKNAYQPQNPK